MADVVIVHPDLPDQQAIVDETTVAEWEKSGWHRKDQEEEQPDLGQPDQGDQYTTA